MGILVDEGIYEILSEVFEKETDETLLVCYYRFVYVVEVIYLFLSCLYF